MALTLACFLRVLCTPEVTPAAVLSKQDLVRYIVASLAAVNNGELTSDQVTST